MMAAVSLPLMRVPLVLATCLSLMACGTRSIPKPGDPSLVTPPEGWRAASSGNNGKISSGWIRSFGQSRLEELVQQAVLHNHDLAIAAARMREVRQGAIGARADLMPSLDLSTGASLSDPLTGPTSENYDLRLSTSWEIDLWGRLRKLSRAGANNAVAAAEDYRDARLSLAASTARAYYNLVTATMQVELARQILESFEKNLRIIERNYRGTGERALDIQFGRNNVASAKRSLESQLLAREEAARSLELLLGRYPLGTIPSDTELPRLPDSMPAGLPLELLERRPDLRAAKARLLASMDRADAARLNLLPSLSITAGSSNSSPSFTRLFDLDELVHSLSGRLGQALFRGGALEADARTALERNRAEIHRYAQTLLEAFREVESALAADRSLARQKRFLDEQLKQAVLAERQSERDYTEGVNPNILSVLEAQRRANNARLSLLVLRNQRIRNRIDLHLALGGDFATKE